MASRSAWSARRRSSESVFWKKGHPCPDPHPEGPPLAQVQGRFQGLSQGLAKGLRLFCPSRQKREELASFQAVKPPFPGQERLEAPASACEKRIPRFPAVGLVDLVKVHEVQAAEGPAPPEKAEVFLQPAAVGEAGEGIVIGEETEALQGPEPVQGVAYEAGKVFQEPYLLFVKGVLLRGVDVEAPPDPSLHP